MRLAKQFTVVSLIPVLALGACKGGSIERTLEEYLRRDARGEQLSTEAAKEMSKLAVGSDHEPAWDVMALITGYEIRSIEQKNDTALATVLFKNVWLSPSDKAFDPRAVGDSTVEVHLIRVGSCWKIGPPSYRPHIRPEPWMQHLEELLRNATKSSENREYIERLQFDLDGARKYIHAMANQK